MKQKQLYAAPATEVLELRLEGVIAQSFGLNNAYNGGGEDWDSVE